MTDSSAQGLAEASPAAFVNGSTKPVAARPSPKVRPTRVTERDGHRHEAAAASFWAWSPELWRQAFVTSCRVHETLHGGCIALLREQLAFAEQAAREAAEAGQALVDEPDGERRTRLLSDYLRHSLERTAEHSALLLELSSRPGGELLHILAEAGAPAAG